MKFLACSVMAILCGGFSFYFLVKSIDYLIGLKYPEEIIGDKK